MKEQNGPMFGSMCQFHLFNLMMHLRRCLAFKSIIEPLLINLKFFGVVGIPIDVILLLEAFVMDLMLQYELPLRWFL